MRLSGLGGWVLKKTRSGPLVTALTVLGRSGGEDGWLQKSGLLTSLRTCRGRLVMGVNVRQ